jgi:hypothetical protein
MGKNVFELIRDFGGRGKIFEVHFRNVTGPLPTSSKRFPAMLRANFRLRATSFSAPGGEERIGHVSTLSCQSFSADVKAAARYWSNRCLLRLGVT